MVLPADDVGVCVAVAGAKTDGAEDVVAVHCSGRSGWIDSSAFRCGGGTRVERGMLQRRTRQRQMMIQTIQTKKRKKNYYSVHRSWTGDGCCSPSGNPRSHTS